MGNVNIPVNWLNEAVLLGVLQASVMAQLNCWTG